MPETPFERSGFVRVFALWAVYAAVNSIFAAWLNALGLAIMMLIIGAVMARMAVIARDNHARD